MYEEYRQIASQFGLQQLTVLIVTSRHRLHNQALATAEWFARKETWIRALEDEMSDKMDAVENGTV